MNREQFEKIMNGKNGGKDLYHLKDNNAFVGLQIIRKYCPTKGVEGADHDVIYSVPANDLVAADITEEDAIRLRNINWMIEDDVMACFV